MYLLRRPRRHFRHAAPCNCSRVNPSYLKSKRLRIANSLGETAEFSHMSQGTLKLARWCTMSKLRRTSLADGELIHRWRCGGAT